MTHTGTVWKIQYAVQNYHPINGLTFPYDSLAMLVKGTVRRYRSYSTLRYFIASEIINYRSNTRIYEKGNGFPFGVLS